MDRWKLEQIEIDPEKKQQVLQQIRNAAEKKKTRYVPSWWNILYGQLKYTSKLCLTGQFGLLLMITLLLGYFQKQGAPLEDYLGLASAASAFSGIFLILELSRSENFGMAELEQTCYLNMKQIWSMKMVLFGAMDIVVLSVLTGKIAAQFCGNTAVIGIYLLVPFVIANAGYLLIFSWIRGKEKLYVQSGLAAAVSILSGLLSVQKEWYDMRYIGIWAVILVVSAVVLAVEILRMYGRIGRGELICWN